MKAKIMRKQIRQVSVTNKNLGRGCYKERKSKDILNIILSSRKSMSSHQDGASQVAQQ